MKICHCCKQLKEESEFSKRSERKDGLQNYCRYRNRKQKREWYAENKETQHAKIYANKAIIKNTLRQHVWAYLLEHPCVDCGESDPIVLSFDHVRGDKVAEISKLVNTAYSIIKIDDEISKCEVRCANCHKRRTAVQLGYWYTK